jgi:polyvinyl alcohol dehydrogenase (cytochrome)
MGSAYKSAHFDTRAAFLAIAALTVAAAVPAAAQDGAALYKQRCAGCHDGTAANRAPDRAVIAALPADRIVDALEAGVMRAEGEKLTPQERRAIAAFLSTARSEPASGSSAAACRPSQAPFLGPGSGDWSAWGVGAANDRYQRQPGIAAGQVPALRLKWAFGFEGETSAAAQPTIAGQRVFVGSASGRVYSLGLRDGCTHWIFKADAGVRTAITIGAGAGSAAAAAYFGDLRATVYSLDAATGELRWKRRVDEHRAARVSGSPVLHDGRLYVPVSSGEEGTAAQPTYECCTFRGSVVALDASTGNVLWQTYMIDETPKPTTKNRAGTQLHGPAGAGVWHAPTIDPSTGSVYVATGDGYTHPAAPRTDAVVALDMKTGAIKWHRQMTAGDAFTMACGTPNPINCPEVEGPDFDFGQPPILVALANGKRALVIGQKAGTAHALDPDERGRVLWSVQLGKGGVLGGFEWGSASDGRNMYLPLSDHAFKDPAIRTRGGADPSAGGGLFAIRLTDGATVWAAPAPKCSNEPCSPAQPAPPAVIPGAVFSGSLDGHLRAYSTTDGKVIWDFDTAREFATVNGVAATGGSIDVGGPAIANGMVFTTSGYPTWGGKRGNVLLAFGID